MTGTLLSIGHGYSARALAARLIPQGWRVIGTTRRAEAAAGIAATGAEPLVWTGGPLGAALAEATHLLTSVAPDGQGDPVLRAAGAGIAAAGHLAWVGYLSTTGVYGDHAGGWVDEDTPPTPSTPNGRARVAAEAAWREVCAAAGVPLHIFRLAGIYGPGRGPFRALRDGSARRIVKPGQVFGRIHVEDIARVLEASMTAPDPEGCIYNVCDDEPSPPQDAVAHAAALIGLPPPPEVPFDPASMSPMAAGFYSESKRVRNDRIRERLGVRLAYPTYREGFAAVLAAERAGG
jgi:nucleoside-diphosphate-sugar epimerase